MNAFQLEGLVKRFNEFQLGPLSLTIEPGSVLSYIGPNGAGKSATSSRSTITGHVRKTSDFWRSSTRRGPTIWSIT